jgi:hypothetical protein
MKPQTRIHFEGLTTRPPDGAMPSWYQSSTNADRAQLRSFMQAIDDLPTAEKRRVAYFDEQRDEWTRLTRLILPTRVGTSRRRSTTL